MKCTDRRATIMPVSTILCKCIQGRPPLVLGSWNRPVTKNYETTISPTWSVWMFNTRSDIFLIQKVVRCPGLQVAQLKYSLSWCVAPVIKLPRSTNSPGCHVAPVDNFYFKMDRLPQLCQCSRYKLNMPIYVMPINQAITIISANKWMW